MLGRAVAAINVDICVAGDILSPSASPALKSVFLDAIRAVPASRDESKSYYEFMQEYYNNDTENPTTNVEEKIKERNILLRDNQIDFTQSRICNAALNPC